MSPATNRQGFFQAKLARLLDELGRQGISITECSIQTNEGVNVAGVAWASSNFIKRRHLANPYPEAPEIVVEILSPSNSQDEMNEKRSFTLPWGPMSFGCVMRTVQCFFSTITPN
ncbi:hypothetical protein CCP3SC1_40086 [Gammaproteobacteria bacterium]